MNINEIAQLAGVSRATVSRYLNDGYVSVEKREKIRDVISRTGYVPSSYAQTLRTNRSGVIGIVVPKISSEAVSRMVDGATSLFAEQGLHPLLGNTSQDICRELEYLSVFQNRQVDGVLFIATVLTGKLEKALKALSMPVVVLGQETALCGCVCYDDFAAAHDLTSEMLRRKRKTIGYIGVSNDDRAAGLARQQGFEAALRENSVQRNQELMLRGAFSVESGKENAKILLERAPCLDGIFCATDNIAAGAMLSLRECGKRVPEDVAVCGVGDSQIAKLLFPPLASANLHYRTGGEEAARMLLELLDGQDAVRRNLRLGCTIAVRESLG